MARVREGDLRRIMAFVASAPFGTPDDPLPRPTLAALRDLVGAEDAEYFELRRADRAVLAAAQSHDFASAPGSEDALLVHGWQNPLTWRRWNPADGVLRLSERIGRRDLERMGFYQEFMRPNRLRDTLKVWLWSSPTSAACIQMWRCDGEFNAREQAFLAVLHHDLIVLREEALGSVSGAWTSDASLTTREGEVLMLACRGVSDEVIAERLGTSTATVGKHLEHAYAKLGVHSRAEALWRLAARPRPAGRTAEAPPT
ncbi:MAG: hypothetical protein H0U86_03905 [Chloroflexi bacterium]|nr:hypothetical protein [Chloroflexota bacterium]